MSVQMAPASGNRDRNVCSFSGAYRGSGQHLPEFVSASSRPRTTRAYPPTMPMASADCFDSDPEWLVPPPRMVAMLNFGEFEGLKLTVPLLVTVEYNEGLYMIEHQELRIFGHGESTAEAVADFLDFLAADYRAYAEEADENLDPNARALAHLYRKLLTKR